MALCPNCKVELGDSAKHCPLCHSPIAGSRAAGDGAGAAQASAASHHEPYPERIIGLDEGEDLTPEQRRKLFLELFTVCSLIAAAVVLAVNVLVEGRLSWSLYPLASIAWLWLLVAIPQILRRHPWLSFAVLGPSSLLFLLALDSVDGSLDWFPTMGLPIGLLLEGLAVACAVLSAAAKRKGINVIAIVLSGTVAACVGVELLINLNFAGRLFLSWSAIVAIAGLPLAGFLFYMHYRIVNRASLRKLFHL